MEQSEGSVLMKVPTLIFFSLFIFFTSVRAQRADFRHMDFAKVDSVAAVYDGHSLHDIPMLAGKLTKPFSTEEEKFRALYKWVCNNIAFDYSLFLQNQKKYKLKTPEELDRWNKKFSSHVFTVLVEEKKTVCTGYAHLVKELALHAGLSCVVIDGYGRNAQINIRKAAAPNHSWNAVRLNNKWYLCDATWSSGGVDNREFKFIKEYNEAYFLANPAVFVRNHHPLDSSWMLLDAKPTLEKFLDRPVTYSSLYDYQITQLYPETFDITTDKGKAVSFQFVKNGGKPIENVSLSIKGPSATNSVFPKLNQDNTGKYRIDHAFTTKGTHIVHVLLNFRYAFTYRVMVK